MSTRCRRGRSSGLSPASAWWLACVGFGAPRSNASAPITIATATAAATSGRPKRPGSTPPRARLAPLPEIRAWLLVQARQQRLERRRRQRFRHRVLSAQFFKDVRSHHVASIALIDRRLDPHRRSRRGPSRAGGELGQAAQQASPQRSPAPRPPQRDSARPRRSASTAPDRTHRTTTAHGLPANGHRHREAVGPRPTARSGSGHAAPSPDAHHAAD